MDILIRNLAEETAAELKIRAAANKRSLQEEIRAILIELAERGPSIDSTDAIRCASRRLVKS
jgi:plasmid stability protein